MTIPFEGFDLSNFWEQSDYANKEYVGVPVTDEMIAAVEQELGYKLPASYIALMRTQNGGIPNNTNHPMTQRTSWSSDHIALTGIFGFDSSKTYSLTGSLGGLFMQEEWEYPNIGVYICDCPSAGHDMIALDYTACGKTGEPKVVHVDQGRDFKITFVADDFETFIRGLVDDSAYD